MKTLQHPQTRFRDSLPIATYKPRRASPSVLFSRASQTATLVVRLRRLGDRSPVGIAAMERRHALELKHQALFLMEKGLP